MEQCLSEQSLRAILDGSASAEQLTKWKRHIRECDSCAAHFVKLQAEHKNISKATTAELHKHSSLINIEFDGRLEPNIQIGDFIIEKRIGSGGMGTVYQARQLSLNRQVALKVMSAGMLMTSRTIERFHREARAAAKLHHTNIVAIYAEGQEDQTCYYAMELVEGQTLDKIIRGLKTGHEKDLKTVLPENCVTCDSQTDSFISNSSRSQDTTSLERTKSGREYFDTIASLIADVADALDYAHKNGIIHRDVKPSNLILGTNGRINLMDFGLARILEEHSVTVTGSFMGTPNYMSPEQVGGTKQKIDHRTDIYSLGVTLYELLTLNPPFAGQNHEQIITQILTREAVRPRKIDNRIPLDLETICCKAMEKLPQQRYQNAGQMAEDLRRYVNRYVITAKRAGPVKKIVKFVQRHKALSSLAAGITIMTAVAALAGWKYFTSQWVQKNAVPNVRRLVDEGLYLEAFPIAKKAERIAPDNPGLVALLSEFTSMVSIDTTPPGAEVYIKSYNLPQEDWTKLGKSPINKIRLAHGLYRWRIVKQGYASLEVRRVLEDFMEFRLEKEGLIPAGMVRVPGGDYKLGVIGLLQYSITLPDFYIDRYEVTNKQYKEFVDSGGYQNERYWKNPIIKDGQVISLQDAIKYFCDSSGQHGPATWENGHYPVGQEDYPVGGISWYEAAAYAEFAGKQLPTVYHWGRTALIGGRYAGSALEFSNYDSTGPAPVGFFQGLADYGTYDMAGNVREWCWNESSDGKRYIMGGGWSDIAQTFSGAGDRDPFDRLSIYGLRCIKNISENPISTKAYEPLISQARDYSKETPISEEEFLIYKKTLYSYEKAPLNPVTVSIDDTPPDWVHETININAAYGDERFALHLYLPKNSSPPYQVIFYFPGDSAIIIREFAGRGLPQVILRSGRAVIYPIYRGTYERDTGLTTYPDRTSESYRNYVIWWAKDIGRAIDYLETRDDIDSDKIGYYGFSWGASLGAIFPAVEERIKTTILVGAGFYSTPVRAEVDQFNFAPYIKTPILMLNGIYDSGKLANTYQKPLFNILGTPEKDKKHVLIKAGHLPRERINKETLDWLDCYFGPAELIKSQ